MKYIEIKYSFVKHSDREYEDNIISHMESIGFECDGGDTSFDSEMTRTLFFTIKDTSGIDIEVNTLYDEEIIE